MFFIINQTRTHKLKGKFKGSQRVFGNQRPTFLHPNEEVALSELLRLSNKQPKCKFVMYEAKLMACEGVLQSAEEMNDFNNEG